MSKDIRSYFAVKPPGSLKKAAKELSRQIGQRKRAVIILDSDSDEDSKPLPVKRNKTSPSYEKPSTYKKKREDSKTTSKYFKGENINVSDVFGARPVKRDNSRNIVKKTATSEIKEFHIDKEFELELLKLDGISTSYVSSNSTNDIYRSKETKKTSTEEETLISSKEESKNNEKHEESEADKSTDEPESLIPPSKKIKSRNKQNLLESENKLLKVIEADNVSLEINDTNNKKELITKHSPTKKSPQKKESLYKKNIFAIKYSLDKSPSQKNISSSTKILQLNVFTSTKDESLQKNDPHRINGNLKSSRNNCILSPRTEVKSKESSDTVSLEKQIAKDPIKEIAYVPPEEKISVSFNDAGIKNTNVAVSHLWVEKYKPTTTKQIIGQQGDKSCVNKLITWLKNWERNHSGNKKLAKPSPWAKNDDGAYFKAALLSGPPGVGKTTTSHLVCNELGFDVVEFNASDTRSKKLLQQEVSELLTTKSLSPFFTGKQKEQVTKKHVLLMDEVDGMAGNEDRGGVQELIQLIKQSRVPIICMCNDRNHPKIRSLANYCFDLRFSKPRVEQIRGAMLSMCFKEKLKLTPDVLSDIITSANHDIRLIINHLSMLSIESSKLANSTKHIKLGPWDVTRKIFSEEEHKTMSIYDKCDLFFHDYNATPLFVQENYLNAVPHKPEAKNKIKKMQLFAETAKCLSLGDLTEKNIRSHNAWSLLPVQAVFSSLLPGHILEGHIGAQINFPAWFGKNSRQTKLSRLLQELTVHSRLKISGNKEAMNLDYLEALEKKIVLPLIKEGTEGISHSLSVLNEYCLIREDLESMTELSSWPNTRNLFSEVDSKVKAAFTRAYNKTSTPTPYAAVPIKKGSKVGADNTDVVPDDEEDSQQPEEEEEDSLAEDAMILVKKKQSTRKVDKEVAPSTSKGSKNSKRGRKK